MIKVLDSFLKEYFRGLKLSPNFYEGWENSFRIDFGEEKMSKDEALVCVNNLFDLVFQEQDDILFVFDVCPFENELYMDRKSLNVYLKYIKRRNIVYKLHSYLRPSIVCIEEDCLHRFIIPCRKNDIRYEALLKTIICELSLDSFHEGMNDNRPYNIYFVNNSKKFIYYLNEHHCDIYLARKEDLELLDKEISQINLDNTSKRQNII
ncbi:hypothetical protein [Bacillus sp. B15-48]|uniref:DUF3885 domain-containing protein n=1 Tax=Bacillus sp. B15-48 TaxID=1548601 RepID=UPI00193F7746|nr:hypothetical protein [Bacillus sp. B15-48]MBM4762825.1 hypothetical protein [Bacillus sp. B15-48]